jgi:hypothetical protein
MVCRENGVPTSRPLQPKYFVPYDVGGYMGSTKGSITSRAAHKQQPGFLGHSFDKPCIFYSTSLNFSTNSSIVLLLQLWINLHLSQIQTLKNSPTFMLVYNLFLEDNQCTERALLQFSPS